MSIIKEENNEVIWKIQNNKMEDTELETISGGSDPDKKNWVCELCGTNFYDNEAAARTHEQTHPGHKVSKQ